MRRPKLDWWAETSRASDAARLATWWFELPRTRRGALLNFAIRTLLLPAFLAWELAGWAGRWAAEEEDGYRTQPGARRGHVKIFSQRFRGCWDESWTLFVQAVVYWIALDVMHAWGIPDVVRCFRWELEAFCATLSGAWYMASNGSRHPSNPSAADPCHALRGGHSLDGHTAACPHAGADSAPADCACRAAFLAACAKLSYEEPPVLRDVVEHRWGLRLLAHQSVPADVHLTDVYVPDMVWFAAASSRGLVLCFEGAQLFNKIDRGTDIPVAMAEHPGCGRLCAGLANGLARPSPSGSGCTIYDDIEALLLRHAPGRQVFLTGHSLGGALACILAQLLAVRQPALAARVSVFTFGAPRIGDAACAKLLQRRYRGRLFRYVHAADMVCKLPHAFQGVPYAHHAGQRLLTSFTLPGRPHRLLAEEREALGVVAHVERWEAAAAFPLGVAKLAWLALQGRWHDAVLRFLFLGMPGIADHFPGHYQEALEELLLPAPPTKGGKAEIGVDAHADAVAAGGWRPQAVPSYRA